MQFILLIYNKLCSLLGRLKKQQTTTPENISIFSIDVDNDYKRNLNIYIPDNINAENVMNIAEAYTSTIIDMGNSKLAQQMIKALELSIDPKNPNEKLLFDNIVYTFVYNTNLKSESDDINKPIIRPRDVFKK